MRATPFALSLFVAIALWLAAPAGTAALAGPPAQNSKASADTSKKNPQNGNAKKDAPTPFQGEVVKVAGSATSNEGKVWVKRQNGTIKVFHVHHSTTLTGAPSLHGLTKGSLVAVVATKDKAKTITVSKLAPPPPPDKVAGHAVTGSVVKVHSDSYGDTGTIRVKPAKGPEREFQVTNATVVEHPEHKDFVHTLQFIKPGQTVHVEHDGGKVALLIAVTAVPSK